MARFSQFTIGAVEYVFDFEATLSRAFFSISCYRKNLLLPVQTSMQPTQTSMPIPVCCHQSKAARGYTWHAYEDALPQVQRLARTTWPKNYHLSEITPQFLKASTHHCHNNKVLAKLCNWALHTPIQVGDSSRWNHLLTIH